MIAYTPSDTCSRLGRMTAKAAFSRSARDGLIASRSKLDSVNAVIRCAVASGRVCHGDRLESARCAIEISFAEAEQCLAHLQKSDDRGWEALRDDFEHAQENLVRAIENLVARFDDEAHQ